MSMILINMFTFSKRSVSPAQLLSSFLILGHNHLFSQFLFFDLFLYFEELLEDLLCFWDELLFCFASWAVKAVGVGG
jgi:hypothetical protein